MEENKRTEEELEQTNPSAQTPDEQTAEEQTTPAAEPAAEEATPAGEVAAEEKEATPAGEAAAEEKEATPAGESAAEEKEAASAEEATPVENSENPTVETAEKKLTSGKLALIIAATLVVLAIAAVLLLGTILSQYTGGGKDYPVETIPASAPEESVEITEAATTEATIPADGNPDDETCKGTYTADNDAVKANADTVVATVGDHQLTNSQLQVFYWMQVQSFLSSDYGSYMMYYGMLDYSQPLDTQVCSLADNGETWQQFFLREALETWRNYCALADQAKENDLKLTKEEKKALENVEETLKQSAEHYGLESVEELLKYNVGAGAGLADYTYFQQLLMQGNKYYDAEYNKIAPTQEELEAYYTEHEKELNDKGITKDGKYVNVRHILLTPEGGTTDENGKTVYSEEEWDACKNKAEDIMNLWTSGAQTEESFAALAKSMSQDPGSQSNGGLYENVQQGQMVEAFDNWCFDEKREPGHNGIVKTDYGYHLMYFVSSTPIWESTVRSQLIAQQMQSMMQELTAQYPMKAEYSKISLAQLEMANG